MILKYFVVQRLDDGKWTNCSCKYFLQGITGALRQYNYTKLKNPYMTLRIAYGKEDVKWECEKSPVKRTVTHWMPNPKLPEVTDE